MLILKMGLMTYNAEGNGSITLLDSNIGSANSVILSYVDDVEFSASLEGEHALGKPFQLKIQSHPDAEISLVTELDYEKLGYTDGSYTFSLISSREGNFEITAIISQDGFRSKTWTQQIEIDHIIDFKIHAVDAQSGFDIPLDISLKQNNQSYDIVLPYNIRTKCCTN